MVIKYIDLYNDVLFKLWINYNIYDCWISKFDMIVVLNLY